MQINLIIFFKSSFLLEQSLREEKYLKLFFPYHYVIVVFLTTKNKIGRQY